jgi:hypothetical protein
MPNAIEPQPLFTVPVRAEALHFVFFTVFDMQEGLGHGSCWMAS